MYKNVLHIQIKYKKNTGWNFLSRTIFIHARVRVKLLNSPYARLFRHYAFRSLRFTSNLSKYLNILYYYNIFVRANVTVSVNKSVFYCVSRTAAGALRAKLI